MVTRSLWMAAIGIFLSAAGWCLVEQVVAPQDTLSGPASEQLLLAIDRDGAQRFTPDMLVGGWSAEAGTEGATAAYTCPP